MDIRPTSLPPLPPAVPVTKPSGVAAGGQTDDRDADGRDLTGGRQSRRKSETISDDADAASPEETDAAPPQSLDLLA